MVIGARTSKTQSSHRVLSLALLAAAIVAFLNGGVLNFVGQAITGRSAASDVAARLKSMQLMATKGTKQKAPKKKKKISLKEALDRQKERMRKGETDEEKELMKEDSKLVPEETFFEGPPSATECLIPFFTCFLVVGIIPFISAVNRQFRVKYKITNRRISVTSGLQGNEVTEFSYQEIQRINWGSRYFGYCADVRIDLRDGAKVELFGLQNIKENYNYIMERVTPDCKYASSPMPNW